MFSMMNTFTDFCIGMLKEPELKALDIEHFDLVVHGLGTSDCFLPLLDNSKVRMCYINAIIRQKLDFFCSLSVF